MRTLSAHLTTMLASSEQTRARCLWLALSDGTGIGLTDHDRDLRIDMTFQSDVPQIFRADIGVLPSDVTTVAGLEADNFEVSGPIGGPFARTLVMGRRFSRARAWLFDVDWTQEGGHDVIPILKGVVADCETIGGTFVLEVRSDAERFNQTIGRLIAPYCDAEFGDDRCRAVVPEAAAVVTAVTDDFRFTLDLAGAYSDEHFLYGRVQFTTGALAGTRPVEIFTYVGASSAVELLAPLPQAPEVGDQLVIRRGCSKLKKSDTAGLPTCLGYDNVINFRGFDQVPGSDQYLKIPVPGSKGA